MNTQQFTFAGFSFPRHIAMRIQRTNAERKRLVAAHGAMYRPYVLSGYYHAPRPDQAGKGTSFYLESDFMPGLRWQWADEIAPRAIKHRGWFTDEHGDCETVRGLVMRLPHNRGFLAGWSMGKGMVSEIGGHVYESERDAALAADEEARVCAEHEREYQEKERAREQEAEEYAKGFAND